MRRSFAFIGRLVFARLLAGRLAALSLAFGLAGGVAAAQSADLCADVGGRCGALVKTNCLARVGAGALSAAPASCAAQLDQYRACVAEAAKVCGGARGAQQEQAYAASLTDEFCAIGVWKGPIVEPRSVPYTMTLEIGSRNGAPFARMRYPELACASRGEHLDSPAKGRILFREIVVENRQRCADGRFAVTCMADGRLHWRWFRDDGENFDAILSR